GLLHALQSMAPVLLTAPADCLPADMRLPAGAQALEHRLPPADMGLDTGNPESHGLILHSRPELMQGLVYAIITAAAEGQLLDEALRRRQLIKGRAHILMCSAQSPGVLLSEDHRNLEKFSELHQADRGLLHQLGPVDHIHQLALQVYHDQQAVVSVQQLPM